MPAQESLLLFRRAPTGLPRRDLKEFAGVLQREVAGGREFCCLITDDRELRRLNRDFRLKDYPTDVLSFPSDEPTESLGDIAISADRAAEQAAEFDHSIAEEIKILMLHGLLHLTGMDHETDSGEMSRSEKRWRKLFNLPAALTERARV